MRIDSLLTISKVKYCLRSAKKGRAREGHSGKPSKQYPPPLFNSKPFNFYKMKTLQIDPKNALRLYPTADATFKQMLEDSFGKEYFSQKITDRVKTFEDACEILGLPVSEVLPNFYSTNLLDSYVKSVHAFAKLTIIASVLNEGWTADWDNTNQAKYYPWFIKTKSGFELYVNYNFTAAIVSSRLCFKSRELAQYAATQFKDLFNDLLSQ